MNPMASRYSNHSRLNTTTLNAHTAAANTPHSATISENSLLGIAALIFA